jgi:hypothetical protein
MTLAELRRARMGPDAPEPRGEDLGDRADPFWQQTFRGRTYADIVRAILAGLGRLKEDFPQMAGFDPVAAEREMAEGPRKLAAYSRDMALGPLDPDAPPGTHRGRMLVHRPTSAEGVIVTIEFHTPEEGRVRRASSERRLAPSRIGEMFLEVHVAAADPRLEERVRAILREEGLELRGA